VISLDSASPDRNTDENVVMVVCTCWREGAPSSLELLLSILSFSRQPMVDWTYPFVLI